MDPRKVHDLLASMRQGLLASIAVKNSVRIELADGEVAADLIDQATITLHLDTTDEVTRALMTRLRTVEDALARLDRGTYGLCTRCQRPIEEERLEAVPETALCLICGGCAAVCGVMVLGTPWGTKGRTVDAFREALGISRRKAQALLAEVPVRIIERVTETEARAIEVKLREVGANVFVFNERAKARAASHQHSEEEVVV